MKNFPFKLLVPSLALVLLIVPGWQQKPREGVKPATEGMKLLEVKKAFAGTEVEKTAKTMSESLEAGQALFEKHCALCHPDGGNIINPKKTLHKMDRDANNIKTAEDIVKTMRNPGPGMTKFTEEKISNDDATKIAEYILHVFQ